MDTVILDGRYSELDFSTPLYTRLTSMLREQSAQLAELPLRSLDIQPCLGCFNCWVRTPGECIQVHGGQQVAQAYMQANLVVFFTPVAFGGYSSVLKKAVDHLIPNISPFFAKVNGETHHHRRYQRYPALLVVGALPAPDAVLRGHLQAAGGAEQPQFLSSQHAVCGAGARYVSCGLAGSGWAVLLSTGGVGMTARKAFLLIGSPRAAARPQHWAGICWRGCKPWAGRQTRRGLTRPCAPRRVGMRCWST